MSRKVLSGKIGLEYAWYLDFIPDQNQESVLRKEAVAQAMNAASKGETLGALEVRLDGICCKGAFIWRKDEE